MLEATTQDNDTTLRSDDIRKSTSSGTMTTWAPVSSWKQGNAKRIREIWPMMARWQFLIYTKLPLETDKECS